MDLTPEERLKIYEEEKARVEAEGSAQPSTHVPTPARDKTSRITFIILGGLLVVAAVIWVLVKAFKPGNPSTNTMSTINVTNINATAPPSLSSEDQAVLKAVDDFNARLPTADKSEEAVRENILTADKSITYEHLKKNADKYAFRPWAFSGTIYQINEAGGQTTALISLDSWGNKIVYVTADFPTEFVEKDKVFVVGMIGGNHSYESVAGWNITVPGIIARAIMKPSDAGKYKTKK